MRIQAEVSGAAELSRFERERLEQRLTGGMRDATGVLKDALRAQVRAAGLGERLARTWQGDAYPKSGASMSPAGFVHSKAPRIVAGFDSGPTITPKLSRFLAIPTENVPPSRGGRRGARRAMSPAEVEHHFNQDLTLIRGARGSILGFVNVVRSRGGGRRKRGGSYRRASAGRLAQGRSTERVLMFTFVLRAKLPKVLDIDAAAELGASAYVRAVDGR